MQSNSPAHVSSSFLLLVSSVLPRQHRSSPVPSFPPLALLPSADVVEFQGAAPPLPLLVSTDCGVVDALPLALADADVLSLFADADVLSLLADADVLSLLADADVLSLLSVADVLLSLLADADVLLSLLADVDAALVPVFGFVHVDYAQQPPV